MPPAALPIIAYYGAAALGASVLVAAFASIAVGAAVGEHQRKKAARAARDAQRAALDARTTMLAMAAGPSSRVYGKVRNVDGVLFKAVRDQGEARIYTLVIQVAGHQVAGIDEVYFNDIAVALDGSGFVTTAPYATTTRRSLTKAAGPGSGGTVITLDAVPVPGSVAVVSADREGQEMLVSYTPGPGANQITVPELSSLSVDVQYQTDAVVSYARVRKFLGAPGQDLSTILAPLFPGLITGADKFEGKALLLVDLTRNPDVFTTGVPSISAVVRGAADVFDPRTSTTGYTANPALIARDWSLHPFGGGMQASELDDASFIAAANACGTTTTFTRPSGSVSLPLYECGIVCRLEGDPTQYLDEIIEACAGKYAWAGGRLRMVAGVYRAPAYTLDESALSDAGSIEIVKDLAADALVNSYTPTIADRESSFNSGPMPAVRPASYIAADGAEYAREITMQGVTHAVHAQHICGVLLRDARAALAVELSAKLHALPLEPFDVVALTVPRYGWAGKAFEVLGTTYTLAGGVRLRLKETNAAIYQVDAGFADLGLSDNTELPLPWEVPKVTGLGVTSGTTLTDTAQPVTRVMASWLPLRSGLASQIELQWRDTVGEPVVAEWVNAAGVTGGWVNAAGQVGGWLTTDPAADVWQSMLVDAKTTTALLPALKPGHVYLFRARALRGAIGTTGTQAAGAVVRSDWCPQVAHAVAAQPLVGSDGIAPDAVYVEVLFDDAAGLQNNPVTMSGRGGTEFDLPLTVPWVVAVTSPGLPVKVDLDAVADFNWNSGPGYSGRVKFQVWDVTANQLLIERVLQRPMLKFNTPFEVTRVWNAAVAAALSIQVPAFTGAKQLQARFVAGIVDDVGDFVVSYGSSAVGNDARVDVRGTLRANIKKV